MGAGAASDSVTTQDTPAQGGKLKLVGYKNFKRQNPRTDRFVCHRFHHIEFWCADATTTSRRFAWGLGLPLVAKSDHSTGNSTFASYVLQSNQLVFTLTAPYSRKAAPPSSKSPQPWYQQQQAYDFLNTHGLAVRAVGVLVEDAEQAFRAATAHGAVAVTEPTTLVDDASVTQQVVAEVKLYGDVVLRLVSGSFQGPFLPSYEVVPPGRQQSYGLQRLDHAVGNVPVMMPVLDYIHTFTGWHEFAEFTAEDVGTVDSGLNSMVLASNNEMVLFPVNEPTFGTPRKSQIQTYLEQNEGPGLQHLALKTDDIIATLRQMRERSDCGGFEFMPRPSDAYYRTVPERLGTDALSPQQLKDIEDLGILADKDDQGILLQIFTKPLSDRPTIFVEIIQRIGCEQKVQDDSGAERLEQAGGCGGFGKGNFSELFKSIEEYEKTLDV